VAAGQRHGGWVIGTGKKTAPAGQFSAVSVRA